MISVKYLITICNLTEIFTRSIKTFLCLLQREGGGGEGEKERLTLTVHGDGKTRKRF